MKLENEITSKAYTLDFEEPCWIPCKIAWFQFDQKVDLLRLKAKPSCLICLYENVGFVLIEVKMTNQFFLFPFQFIV
jgi:hypothetical protein